VVILVPLLFFNLTLLSVQVQNPGAMTPIKTMVLSIQGPAVHAVSGTIGGVRNLWERYLGLVGTQAENKVLQEEIRHLKRLNRSYDEIRQENIRLRHLLSLSGSIEYDSISARVIARAPEFLLANVLYIDRGRKDGVQVDLPVLSGSGIIGRTVYVAGDQSQVQLITNPDASVGVMLENTRTPGVLRGTGELLMDLSYINNTEQIQAGDSVLTSGLDGIFPKGFLIGKVADFSQGDGIFYDIRVRPLADFRHIEEVSVLMPRLP
jgi:rod shape-determining protein MreC